MSDDQVTALLEQIQALCDRVRFLEGENVRLRTLLKAQIQQYGELYRSRKLDGETVPEYVTNITNVA